jgi:GDPmannose 4,6-dehydratase
MGTALFRPVQSDITVMTIGSSPLPLPPLNGKIALVTGITGQDGSYLAEFLLAKGYEVWGVVRRTSSLNTSRIAHLLPGGSQQNSRFHLAFAELGDSSSLVNILRAVGPDEVYNLGGQSYVKVSFDIPEYTCDVTGMGTIRLLEAIRELDLRPRFFQASSSEMFGKAVESPQSERTPFHPRSPYAVAKVFAHFATINYRESYNLFAVSGIMYNHESPRRGEMFVTRKITLAAARISAGSQQELTLGNLEARRDWGFAGDYVDGMWRMMQAEEPVDYVMATGTPHSVREFCEKAFAQAGLPLTWSGKGVDEVGIGPDGRRLVRIDPEFFRPAEVDLLRGDSEKIRNDLGWAPKVDFDQLVRMMVDHDVALALAERNRGLL